MTNDNWNNQNQPQGGWDPNQQQPGWDPNQQQPGWDPNQQQPGQPGQPQQGWDQPQASNYNPATQGWDPNAAAYGAGYGAPAAPLASWGKRALGWLIDWLVPSLIIGTIISSAFPQDVTATTTADSVDLGISGTGSLVQILLWLALFAAWSFLASKDGQTPGRKVAKTQLLDENMRPVSLGKGLGRYIVQYLLAIPCGLTWWFPLWDKQRQTLADKIMNTKVYDISQTGPVNRA
ncbi:RDD family protein [Aestuariimicrobium ganziense]|uniref:RDD family protein n=1 Tax=Aestuariimicrobium ganziense TaxID=2773677 RepID=UPI0019430D11|nr:RDD family protein [Aestuariimicrobium ganziense]